MAGAEEDHIQGQALNLEKSTKSIKGIVIAATEKEAEHQKERNVKSQDYNLEKKYRSRDRD